VIRVNNHPLFWVWIKSTDEKAIFEIHWHKIENGFTRDIRAANDENTG
jgi:hypothetical protein